MTKKKETPFNNPFASVKLKTPPVEKPLPPAPVVVRQPLASDDEAMLFLEAVGEVEPVRHGPTAVGPPPPDGAAMVRGPHDDAESMARLAELVSATGAFDIADTDSTIEASVHGFDARVMRKLRSGEFDVRATMDLHGMTREAARVGVEAFIQKARIAGHRCVLIITGKGLNSVDQIPVLKIGVQQWLTQGRARSQVLAFCTAKPKDGGAGALYVLLRR